MDRAGRSMQPVRVAHVPSTWLTTPPNEQRGVWRAPTSVRPHFFSSLLTAHVCGTRISRTPSPPAQACAAARGETASKGRRESEQELDRRHHVHRRCRCGRRCCPAGGSGGLTQGQAPNREAGSPSLHQAPEGRRGGSGSRPLHAYPHPNVDRHPDADTYPYAHPDSHNHSNARRHPCRAQGPGDQGPPRRSHLPAAGAPARSPTSPPTPDG